MRRIATAALAALLLLPLTGCRRYAGMLPYAREIENMELMQTLGVDKTASGRLKVTASGGTVDDRAATVVDGQAGAISAAILSMQAEGSSYLYFGHVGQLLLGEMMAADSVAPALDYVLRDVEMRLDTALYVVKGDTASRAIGAAAKDGSAAARLEAMAQDAGLLARSMTRTVQEVLTDLAEQGASFAPAIQGDGGLTAAGYGILKEDALVGWAEGEAALGVNLILGRVDADVAELSTPETGDVALRIVGARTKIRPVCQDGVLTGLELVCKVDANLAEGEVRLVEEEQRSALEHALAQRENRCIQAALDQAKALDADYLGLLRSAALRAPWYKEKLVGRTSLAGLDLHVTVTAGIQRSYEAG